MVMVMMVVMDLQATVRAPPSSRLARRRRGYQVLSYSSKSEYSMNKQQTTTTGHSEGVCPMSPPRAWSAAVRAATEVLSGFWCEPGRHDRPPGVPWLQLAATAAYLSSINCASTVMSMQNQIKVIARSTSYAPHMSLTWNEGLPLKYHCRRWCKPRQNSIPSQWEF
jgi:hypothetical protein